MIVDATSRPELLGLGTELSIHKVAAMAAARNVPFDVVHVDPDGWVALCYAVERRVAFLESEGEVGRIAMFPCGKRVTIFCDRSLEPGTIRVPEGVINAA